MKLFQLKITVGYFVMDLNVALDFLTSVEVRVLLFKRVSVIQVTC